MDTMKNEKMELKVIILSYTKDADFLRMLKGCVDSIHKACESIEHEIVVVETGNMLYELDVDSIIRPNEEFNYNRFLNIALERTGDSELVLISNNDVVYEKESIEHLVSAVRVSGYDSVSPWEPSFHPRIHKETKEFYKGYRIRHHVAGWSILVKMSAIVTMGKFDEQFNFWGQDDDYGNNLEKHGLKHALINGAKAHHLSHDHKTGRSHALIKKGDYHEMTIGGINKTTKKWNR